MRYEYPYKNLEERKAKIIEAEKLGYTMLHDNFDADWKHGDEPHGIMIFTDEIPIVEPRFTYEAYRDLGELGEQIITRRTINRELTTTEIANLEVKHNVKIRRVL